MTEREIRLCPMQAALDLAWEWEYTSRSVPASVVYDAHMQLVLMDDADLCRDLLAYNT